MSICEDKKTLLSTALLTSSESTRNKLLDITKRIEDIKSNMAIDNSPEWGVLLDSTNKELEATLYATLLNWEERAVYKQVLISKFKSWLSTLPYDNMVSILEAVDNNWFALAEEIFTKNEWFYSAMWIESIDEFQSVVKNLTSSIENKMLTDYVYFGWKWLDDVFKRFSSIKNISYDKLSKAIAKSANIKKAIKEVTEKQSVYFDVFVDNETRLLDKVSRKAVRAWEEKKYQDAVNNYLSFLAVTNPKVSLDEAIKASELIKDSASKWLGSIENIKKLSTPKEIQEFVVSNIWFFRKNKEWISAIKEQYNIVSAWWDLPASIRKIMDSASEGFDSNAVTLHSIISTWIDSYETSVVKKNIAKLNAAWWKNINVSTIVKKLSYLDDNSDDFIKRVVKAYGEKITPEQALEIESIAENIANSILKPHDSTNLWSYIVESISWKPVDINKSVFFESSRNIPEWISEDNLKIARAYDEAYQSNSIEIWNSPDVVTDTNTIFERWKNWDITSVIVKNQDDYRSSEIQELLSKITKHVKESPLKQNPYLVFAYPKEHSLVSYFSKDGKLYAGSWDRRYLWTIVDALQDAELPVNMIDVSKDIVQTTKDALRVMYWPDNAYAIEKLRSAFDSENIQDIQKDLKVINALRNDISEWYYNIAEKFDELPNDSSWYKEKVKNFANALWLDGSSIENTSFVWVDISEIKKLYLSAIYWESTASIARWQDALLQFFWINGWVSYNKVDRYYNILQRVRAQWLEIPFGDANKFMSYVDGFWEIDDAFIQKFVVRNRSLFNGELDVNRAVSIFKDAKKFVDENVVSKITTDFVIEDSTKRMFRFQPQSRVVEAKQRIANIDFSPRDWVVPTESILVEINKSIDDYYNSVESIIKKNGRLSQEDAVALRQEMQSSLVAFEDEIKNQFWDIIPDRKIYRSSFEVKKITESSELPYLRETSNELKKRYANLISNINKNLDNESKWAKALIEEKWYVYDTIEWKTKLFTIDDAIEWKIDELSSYVVGIDKFKAILGEWVDLFKKKSLLKILDVVESMKYASWNVISKIYETFDKTLKSFITDYRVVDVDWRILPNILSKTNATRHLEWVSALNSSIDLDIKESIFKSLSKYVREWNLTPELLDWIISKEVDKYYVSLPNDVAWQLNIKWIKDAYFSSFAWYTKLFKIPQDIIDSAVKIAKRTTNYTEQELYWLKQLSIETADWNLNLSDFVVWNVDTSMPDVLYRNMNDNAVSIWRVLDENERLALKDNVESMVDEYMNWFEERQAFNDSLNVWVFNQAKPIMQREWGRLWRWVTMHNVLKSAAEKAHFSLMDWLIGKRRTIWRYYFTGWYGSASIPTDRLDAFKKAFSESMSLENSAFNQINPAYLSPIENSAYKVATYVKKYKANIGNITTNQDINKELLNVMEEAIMWIKDVKWLEEVSTAIRNFTPFSLLKKSVVAAWVLDTKNKFFWAPENMKAFNEMFNSKLWLYDYRTVVATIFGVENTAMSAFDKIVKRVWRLSTSPFMRTLFSIPWSFMTAPISTAGYINEYAKLSKQLWVGIWDMEWITAWRLKNNILTQEWPDISTMMRGVSIAISESKSPMDYIKNMGSLFVTKEWQTVKQKLSTVANRFFDSDAIHTLLTQTIDNWQNIVDSVRGSSMKNMSTIHAIKNNKYIKFTWFEDFTKFMDNPDIPEYFKRKIQQDVVDKSYDMYQTIIPYWGSSIYKSINTWKPVVQQMQSIFNAVHNPINFRGSLWLNTIKEAGNALATWLKAIKEIAYNPSKSWAIIDALANNVHIQKIWHSLWFDALMTAKVWRLWNAWEDAQDREIWPDDIKDALWLFSLQYQLWMTSWVYRIIKPLLEWDDYAVWWMVNAYVNNFWRQIKSLQLMSWGLRALTTGWVDWFNDYMDNTLKTASTAAARMFVLDRDSASAYTFVPQKKSWMSEVRWWDNDWLKVWFMAWNIALEEKMKNSFKDWKIDFPQIWDLFLDILNQSQAWRTIMNVADSVRYTFWDKSIREKAIKNKDELEKRFMESDIYKRYIDNWLRYTPNRPSPTAWKEEWDKYYELMGGKWGIYWKLSIYWWPWTVSKTKWIMEKSMIESYINTGKSWNDYMDNIYRSLEKDGLLQWRLDKINSTPWNKEYDVAKELNLELADYIQSKPIEDRPAGSDMVILSMLVWAEFYKNWSSYEKLRKQQTWDKKYDLSPDEWVMMKAVTAEKYLWRYQDILSDGNYSHWWFGLAINEFVKSNPDVLEWYVNTYTNTRTNELGKEEEYTSYSMMGWYKNYLENIMKSQAEILDWKDPWTAIVNNHWIQNFVPQFRKWKDWDNADEPINLAIANYMDKWLQSRDDLTPLQKAQTRVSMYANAWLSWKNEEKIKESLWEVLYNNYKFSYYQAYNDWIQAINDIYDASSSAGGKSKWSSTKAPDLSGLWEWLAKMRSSISKNWWIPNRSLPKREIIRPFEYDWLKTIQDRQASKWWVNYSAISKSIFDKQWAQKTGKDISRKITPTKVSLIKKTWTKKS